MHPKAFISLAAATVVMVIAAVVAVVVEPSVSRVSVNNEPAFEALRAAPQTAARLVIETRDVRITLDQIGDGVWGAPDRDNYPAKSEQVGRVIAEMADMQLIERKTQRPERYSRLALEDIDAEEAQSRLVSVYDANDNLLAEAIVGRRRDRVTGVQTSGTYIRKPGEQQAWLASGAINISDQLAEWLEDDVLNVLSRTVQQVEINNVAGGAYTAYKDTAEVPLKVISELPEGKQVRDGALSRLAAGLSNVSLVDVMPSEEFVLPEEHFISTYRTFDGVEVTAVLAEIDEEGWATFEARYVGTEGEGEPEAVAEAKALVEEINVRAEGWAFQLQDHVYSRLTVALADILEDIPPPGAAGDDPAAMFPGGLPQQVGPGGEQPQIPPEVMQQLQQQLMQQQLQQQQQQPQPQQPAVPAPAP